MRLTTESTEVGESSGDRDIQGLAGTDNEWRGDGGMVRRCENDKMER